MKILFSLLLIFIFTSCSTKSRHEFAGKDVCFLLYNLKTDKFEEIRNKSRCETRFPPASTFKIPLAVMGFDSKVLVDRNTSYKWDGKKRFLDVWNKDHSAYTWMQESVVWFSQELTPKIGMQKIENYLSAFEYGNQDMSGGIKFAWLLPKLPEKNSLKISAFEQVGFMKKLWRGELKATSDSQLKTIDILVAEGSRNGNRILGKTGSGSSENNNGLRLGWWIGFLETKSDQYVVVINFTDKQKSTEATFGGPESRTMAKKLLVEKGLWKD